MKLPSHARRKLSKWSKDPDSQLHRDLYTLTKFCLEDGWSADQIYAYLRKVTLDEKRFVPDRELRGAIDYAMNRKTEARRWSDPDITLQLSVAAARHRVIQVSDPLPYLRDCFLPDDYVCCSTSPADFFAWKRDRMLDDPSLFGKQYIVPNPMKGSLNLTMEGKYSSHCLANVKERTTIIVEFDQSTMDQQISFHHYLSNLLRLRFMVWSGNKSIHGWYACQDVPESSVGVFFDTACKLGADRTLWSPVQFTRLPGGINQKTKHTQIILKHELP